MLVLATHLPNLCIRVFTRDISACRVCYLRSPGGPTNANLSLTSDREQSKCLHTSHKIGSSSSFVFVRGSQGGGRSLNHNRWLN